MQASDPQPAAVTSRRRHRFSKLQAVAKRASWFSCLLKEQEIFMTKLRFPSTCVAAAFLVSACGGYDAVTPAPHASTYSTAYTTPVVVAPAPAAPVVSAPGTVAVMPQQAVVIAAPSVLRPGYGRVDSVTPMSSGSRIAVRMENGQQLQYLDAPGGTMVALGQRVEITSDGHMSYPIPERR
jgi:hypothetical protein